MKPNILHFFSTPVFSYEAGVPDRIAEQLVKDCYGWREADKEGVHKSNNRGWHSTTDIFTRTEETFIATRRAVIECCNASTKTVAPGIDLDKFQILGEGWVNINPQHGFNAPHDHPGFTWSAVYYVKMPTVDNPDSKSGRIEFLDPRTNIAAMALEFSRTSDFFAPKQVFKPKENQIIVFPSYLRHWVYPNDEDADRISMAFNIKYKLKT
jgi:uncharacterized protein (TIGR02466 family)